MVYGRIEDELLQIIRRNQEGITLTELTKEIKAARHTLSVHLAFLEGAGLVRTRVVGRAKLYLPETKWDLEEEDLEEEEL